MLSEQVEFERRNAKKVPLTSQRCFHPVRVFNRYMNEYIYVNCRKCDGCLSARSAELTARVANECKQHPYSIFFTLTYDNEHLPVMRFHSRNLFLGNRPIGFDRKSRNYLYPSFDVSEIGDFDLSELVPTNYPSCDGFAYANKYDVQKWLMRLRSHIMRNQEFKYTRVNKQIVRFLGTADYIKNLSKDEKSFRYFICSEYGPQYYRPHYHGIIWCDSEPLARYLLRNILEDWSLGSKTLDKPSLVNSSAPSYVAKYVNGSTRLPQILQTKSFHSFVLASKNPIIGSFKNDLLQVTDALINGVVEQLQPVDKRELSELAFVPISTALCSRYFPKCASYRQTDVYGKLSIFEKYRKGNFRKEFRLNPDGSKSLVNLPECDYQSDQIDAFNTKLKREDFFVPEFADLGKQPTPIYQFKFTKDTDMSKVLGWNLRYSEYKTSLDMVHGVFNSDDKFQNQSYNAWVAPRNQALSQYSNGATVSFFKALPSVLNQIMVQQYDGTEQTDQFLINAQFGVQAIRPMSIYGEPSLN